MDRLKLGFMTSLLKSGYHKWMPYYILALAFSIASQTLELLPIVPQKKCVPQDILCEVFSIAPVLSFKISEYFDFRSEGCLELEVRWVGSPSSIQLAPQRRLPPAEVVVVNLEGEEANPRSSPRKLSTPRTRFHSCASLGGERREMSPQGSDISISKTICVLVTPMTPPFFLGIFSLITSCVKTILIPCFGTLSKPLVNILACGVISLYFSHR